MTRMEEDEMVWKCWKACMTTLAIAATILIATVVVADAARYFVQPPVKYTGEPVNYVVKLTTLKDIRSKCGNPQAYACTGVPLKWRLVDRKLTQVRDENETCIILMPHEAVVPAGLYGQLLTHEWGHCNGWPGDHPNERKPL